MSSTTDRSAQPRPDAKSGNMKQGAESSTRMTDGPDSGKDFRGAAGDLGSSAKETAAGLSNATEEVTGAAKEAIVTAARAVTSQASDAIGNVAAQIGSSVEEQKGRGADSLSGLAHAIKTAAAELDQQSPAIASQFRGASDRIERLSGNLRDRKVEELITDYSNLARTQPAAFFAGAMIAGFALSRFVKSSAQRQQRQDNASTSGEGL